MTKPKFRLEQVLAERKRREDIRQQELAAAQMRLSDEQAQLARLRDEAQEQQRRARHKAGARVSSQDLQGEHAFLERLTGEIDDQGQLVSELGTAVTRSRDALAEALKEKKAIERLKEKHLQQVADEERAVEGRVIDDIVMTRFARRRL